MPWLVGITCIIVYAFIFIIAWRLAEKKIIPTLLFVAVIIFLFTSFFVIPIYINDENKLAYNLMMIWGVFFAPVGMLLFILFFIISLFNIIKNKIGSKNIN